MAPSTTCSHGGIVEGLLCQCPAPGEHSGPYRWDGRGLVPGWDRTGTPAVPCDGQPAQDRLPRLCGFAPVCRVGGATPPLTTLRAPPCAPHPVPRASVPLPRAPGRCSSAPTAAPRSGCFPVRRSTAARCSPLPAAASCRPAVLSRLSRLLRHSADLLLRVLRVFTCSASAPPPPNPPRPVSPVVPLTSWRRGCLRTVNVRAPRAVPGSRHFIRESARGRVSGGRSGGAGCVRWVPGGAGRGPGGSGVRENGGESTLAIVLIFCMSEGARTTSEGPEDDTHARVAE